MTRSRLAVAAAWTLAAVGTVASLYASLGLGLAPCRLCWYQRVLMYPLVVVLGVALSARVPVGRLVLPLSLPGAAIAAYHSWLQVAAGGHCTFAGCSVVRLRVLGLTLPNLSLLAFVAVSALVGAVVLGRGATDADPGLDA